MSSFRQGAQSAASVGFLPFETGAIPAQGGTSSIFGELVRRADHGALAPEPALEDTDEARKAAEHAAELEQAVERGRLEGIAEVHRDFGDVAAGFHAALAELVDTRQRIRERHEGELLGVAVQVAEKILVDELAGDPARWLPMIREGVGRTLDRDRIRVRVGRALHHFLAGRIEELQELLDDVQELELVEDKSLDATGCVIETAFCDLDLSLGSQLEALAERLMGKS